MSEARVSVGERLIASLPPGAEVVLGRADGGGTVGLDAEDRGISARQVAISHERDALTLRNLSASRSLLVEYADQVRHRRLPPGELHLVAGPALVLVSGVVHTHGIGVEPPPSYTPALAPVHGDTSVGLVTLSDRDRDALVALFSGYLRRWPRHQPEPLSYDEAGALISETGATVRKRVERVRERVNTTDVVYIDGRNALRDLADHLIDAGQLHPSDLTRIGVPVSWRGPSRPTD